MPRLEYIDNTGQKAQVALGAGVNVSIGRNPGSTIQTANPSVSRNHGRIFLVDGAWHVKDLGSSNGTFVNDDPVKETRLKAQDRVRFGDFVVNFLDADASAQVKIADHAPKPAQELAKPTVDGGKPPARPTVHAMKPMVGVPPEAPKPRPPPPASTIAGSRPVLASSNEQNLIEQIKEQGGEIERLRRDLTDHRTMVRDLEVKLTDWESRAKRYEVELDSVTERYVELRDQLTLTRERLDEAREEVEEGKDKLFQAEAKLLEGDEENAKLREKTSSNQEYVQSFKIKLTQKDRQLEDLQRQYDLMEFELRAAKERDRDREDDDNELARERHKLERRINQLREIIADKENVVSEQRTQLENKDIEIRQIRMGVGLSSLEDEKRKLLEDYYAKVREVDDLRGKLEKSKHDRAEADIKLKDLQADADKRAQAASDIASHPDFKAKVREATRLEERLHEVEAELGGAQAKLAEFNPDEKKRLQGEVAFYKRKSSTIEEKMQQGQARLSDLERQVDQLQGENTSLTASQAAAAVAVMPTPSPTSALPVQSGISEMVKEDLGRELEALFDMFDQWRGNFSVLKTYLREVESAVKASPTATDPEQVDPRESVDSMKELVSVIDSDAGALKSGLFRLQKQVGSA